VGAERPIHCAILADDAALNIVSAIKIRLAHALSFRLATLVRRMGVVREYDMRRPFESRAWIGLGFNFFSHDCFLANRSSVVMVE
jgi:hypothetical protein